MSSNFPNNLDTFVNPNATDTLDDTPVPHHSQHTNLNDSVLAIEERVGVTGSLVATTIDFELHNTGSGHDHDGINSRPVALGPDSQGILSGASAYPNGYLTDLSGAYRVGAAVDRLNQAVLTLSTSIDNISGSGTGSFDLRQIIILEEQGPFEGFGTGSYQEFVYSNRISVTSSIWYTDTSKTKKIFEKVYFRNTKAQATQVLYNLYGINGTSIIKSATDNIVYDGPRIISRTRTIS